MDEVRATGRGTGGKCLAQLAAETGMETVD
jgi:hypothetical protein